MSYDFDLYRLLPGADLGDVVGRDAPEEGEPDTRPLRNWDSATRDDAIAALLRLNPSFESSGGELCDERLGLTVSFFDTEVGVSAAYWHGGDQAAPALRVLWECLRALAAAGDAVVFDPQLDRALDLDRDFNAVAGVYAAGVGALHRTTAPRRPWWRFW